MDENGYKSLIKHEFGVDFLQLRTILGHWGGVHGDNMYLIAKLAALPEVENVIEFGSGMSSLVFGKLQQFTGKNFISMEDHPHWADVINVNLEELGVSHRVISTRCDPNNCPDFDYKFQVAFVDGSIFHVEGTNEPGEQVHCPVEFLDYTNRGGACFYYQEQLEDAVLIWDDAESLVDYIPSVVSKMGRDPDELFWFNPTGRSNRHQRISLPEKNKELYRNVIEQIPT